jgi:hypothetical protein
MWIRPPGRSSTCRLCGFKTQNYAFLLSFTKKQGVRKCKFNSCDALSNGYIIRQTVSRAPQTWHCQQSVRHVFLKTPFGGRNGIWQRLIRHMVSKTLRDACPRSTGCLSMAEDSALRNAELRLCWLHDASTGRTEDPVYLCSNGTVLGDGA